MNFTRERSLGSRSTRSSIIGSDSVRDNRRQMDVFSILDRVMRINRDDWRRFSPTDRLDEIQTILWGRRLGGRTNA